MSNLLTLGRVCLPAILSGLSCRQAAIRFGASSAIPCRTMERVQGDAKPKAVVARPALDAPGPSCGRPFARWSMRPGTSRSKSSGRRWPRDASGKLRRAVALLSPPQDHAQKRPRMARAGSPRHREAPRAWFNGQLESRSRPPCVQHRNARPRPIPAAGADGCRNGQRLRVAFLMCTPKQRPSSPDCTLTKSSLRWFWTDPQTAPPLSALQRIQI